MEYVFKNEESSYGVTAQVIIIMTKAGIFIQSGIYPGLEGFPMAEEPGRIFCSEKAIVGAEELSLLSKAIKAYVKYQKILMDNWETLGTTTRKERLSYSERYNNPILAVEYIREADELAQWLSKSKGLCEVLFVP